MTFEDAVNHRMNVVEISVTAKAQGRTPLLGVLYDELARCVLPCSFYISISVSCGRRHWEDMSLKLGRGFCISVETAKLSEDLLRQAKNLHDTLFRSASTQAPAASSVCLCSLIC